MLSKKTTESQEVHHKALLQAANHLGQFYSTRPHPGSLSKEAPVLIMERGQRLPEVSVNTHTTAKSLESELNAPSFPTVFY